MCQNNNSTKSYTEWKIYSYMAYISPNPSTLIAKAVAELQSQQSLLLVDAHHCHLFD